MGVAAAVEGGRRVGCGAVLMVVLLLGGCAPRCCAPVVDWVVVAGYEI